MPGLPRRITALLVALAICTASGTHWMLLQTVAWAGMVALYAQDRPLTEAVADTLDGEHPCALCVAIKTEQGKEQEQKRQGTPATALKQLFLVLAEVGMALPPEAQQAAHLRNTLRATARAEAPPVPPPRAA